MGDLAGNSICLWSQPSGAWSSGVSAMPSRDIVVPSPSTLERQRGTVALTLATASGVDEEVSALGPPCLRRQLFHICAPCKRPTAGRHIPVWHDSGQQARVPECPGWDTPVQRAVGQVDQLQWSHADEVARQVWRIHRVNSRCWWRGHSTNASQPPGCRLAYADMCCQLQVDGRSRPPWPDAVLLRCRPVWQEMVEIPLLGPPRHRHHQRLHSVEAVQPTTAQQRTPVLLEDLQGAPYTRDGRSGHHCSQCHGTTTHDSGVDSDTVCVVMPWRSG